NCQADAGSGVLDGGRGGHDLAVVFVGGGGDVLRHRAAVGDVDGDGRGRGRLDAVVVGDGVVEGVGGLAHRQRLEIRRRGRVVGEGAVAIVADGGAVGAERIGGIAGGQADAVAGVLDGGRGGHDLAVVFVGGGGDVLRHRAAVGDVDGDGRGRGRLDAVVVGDGVVDGVGEIGR